MQQLSQQVFPCDEILLYNCFIPSESIAGILRSSWYSRLAVFFWLAYTPCDVEATNSVLSVLSIRCLTRTPLFLKVLFSFHTFGIVVPTILAMSSSVYCPSEINSCMRSFLLGLLLGNRIAMVSKYSDGNKPSYLTL
jgi:hypothetical protein